MRMRNVKSMSRLERLRMLRARVDAEIAVEEAAEQRRRAVLAPVPPLMEYTPPDIAVAPAEIRDWARAHGIEVPRTGRLPTHVRDAYARAHTPALV